MSIKYTKIDLIDMISARLISKEIHLTKKQISAFLDIYHDSIYEILLDGEPVSMKNLGVFKFKTMQPRSEKPYPQGFANPKGLEFIPAVPMYTKVKFKINDKLAREVKEKTIDNPFDTKTTDRG